MGACARWGQNLLLGAGQDITKVTLIDFGLSRFFAKGQRLMTRVGTVYYTAPEVRDAAAHGG